MTFILFAFVTSCGARRVPHSLSVFGGQGPERVSGSGFLALSVVLGSGEAQRGFGHWVSGFRLQA